MTVYREWRPAARLAAILADGFRVAVIAGFVSLISLPPANAANGYPWGMSQQWGMWQPQGEYDSGYERPMPRGR